MESNFLNLNTNNILLGKNAKKKGGVAKKNHEKS